MRNLLSTIPAASRSLTVLRVTLLALMILPFRVHAQCDLSAIGANAYETCADVLTPFVSLWWSGGTPPFNVYIETTFGAITQTTVSTQNWSGPINATLYDPSAQITISDAMGCTEVGVVGWQNHVTASPVLLVMHSCTSGGTIRWAEQFYLNSGFTPQPSFCAGPFSYQITNNTTGAGWSGSIASDWVQESAASWRFVENLPTGSYSVSIYPTNSLPGPSCEVIVDTECYTPVFVNVPVDLGDCGTNFRLRAALAGALPSGTLMTDQLRSSGLLPLVEPYSAAGYSYVGTTSGMSIPASMLEITGSNAIVDWVVVEVREPNAPYTVLHSRPALIQRDGDVIDADGSSYINAPLTPGSYRVALRHRNHLGVMSNTRTLSLSPTNTLVDLSSLSTSVYGSNARVAVGSVQCLWPGDANFDGTAIYTGTNNDRDLILTAIGGTTPTNTVNNTYSPFDINMDGVIRYTGTNNDRDIILQTIGGVVPTATRTQQLP